MKKSLQCPKCDGRQIAHIARMAIFAMRPSTQVGALPLVVRKNKGLRAGFVPFANIGGYESFVCRGCGYSELYAIDFDKLDPELDKDVRFLDNEPKATLR